MNQARRAIIAIVLVALGYGLMVLAYDKPEWYFIASGIVGTILCLGTLGWWIVSGIAAWKRQRAHI